MASYHCTVKVGGKGKAAAHADYIARDGKYEKSNGRYEDFEYAESGNMPQWSAHKPSIFWSAADEHERANGATYREIEVALPRELSSEQRIALVKDFVSQEIGDRHAYTFAIHNPRASIDGGEQPHAHIMYSERTRDSYERDPHQYFKRYNAKSPEKGGCKKDSAGTEERLQQTRQKWAEIQNEHLARHGHDARVDHRSLKERGINREPEQHIGAKRIQSQQLDVSALLERRAAEGALERSRAEMSRIDVSGDLRSALKERERKAMEEFKRAAAEARAQRDAEAKRQQEKRLEMPSAATLQQGVSAFKAQFDAEKVRQAQEAARQKAEQERQARAERERKMQPPARTLANIERLQQSMDRARERKQERDYDKPKGMSR